MKRGRALRRRYGRAGTVSVSSSSWDEWRAWVELQLMYRFITDGMRLEPARNVAARIVSNEDAKLKVLHAQGMIPAEVATHTIPPG